MTVIIRWISAQNLNWSVSYEYINYKWISLRGRKRVRSLYPSRNYHKFTLVSIHGFRYQWSFSRFFFSFEAESNVFERSSPSLWSIQLAVFVRPIRLRSISNADRIARYSRILVFCCHNVLRMFWKVYLEGSTSMNSVIF